MPLVRCVSSVVPDCSVEWTLDFMQRRRGDGAIIAEDNTYTSLLVGNGLTDPGQQYYQNLHYVDTPFAWVSSYVPIYTNVGNIVTMAIPAPPSGYSAADITEVRWQFTGRVDWTSSLLGGVNMITGDTASGYHGIDGLLIPILFGFGGPGWAGCGADVFPQGAPRSSLKSLSQQWAQAASGADVLGDGYEYYTYRTKYKFGDANYSGYHAAPESHVFRPISEQPPNSLTGVRHNIGLNFVPWLETVLGSTVHLRYGVNVAPSLTALVRTQTPGTPITYSGTIQEVANCSGFFLTLDIIYGGDDGPVTTSSANPWNLQDRFGRYHRVDVQEGVRYRRSDYPVPRPSWAVTSQITAADTDTHPRVIVDDRARVRVTFARSGNMLEAVSDDDGVTWETPTTMISGGTYPTIACGTDGSLVRAAYVGGNLVGTYQAPGDTTQSAPFTFQDDTGTDLAVAEGTFHIQQAHEGPARWLLAVVIDGDDDTSDWYSADECRTWTLIP